MGVTKKGFDDAKRVHSGGSSNIDDDDMLERLQRLGEAMTNHARTITKGHASGGYEDWTHNLRSSIAYRIFKDGTALCDGGFKRVTGSSTAKKGKKSAKKGKKTASSSKRNGNGELGEPYARMALEEFSKKVPQRGWTILIVAGMDYAKYVEDKGYNVLYLTGIELEKQITELKKKLGLTS